MRLGELRKAWWAAGGTVVALAAWTVVALGGFPGPEKLPSYSSVLLFGSLTLLSAVAVARRVRFVPPPARAQRRSLWFAASPVLADTELGLVLVTACYAVFSTTGGMGSPLYPLLYGVVAFSATMMSGPGAIAVVASALLLELTAPARATSVALETWISHLVFLAAAALLHALFLRGLVRRLRRDHGRRVAGEIARLRQSARDYRLIAAPLGAESRPARSREEEQEELAAGSVELLSIALLSTLELLKRGVEARTAAILWLDDRGEALSLKEALSDCDWLVEDRRVPIAGALRAIVREGHEVCLSSTRPGQVPYYERSAPVGSFAGVPIREGVHLRGALCADRDAPFHAWEVELLAAAARQVAQVVRTEQIFGALERAKYEHERFYQASAMLSRALTLEQVMETAFDAAALIADYDVAVIALYDRERRRHRVQSSRFKPGIAPVVSAAALAGLEFRDNAGLASMVVKNRHYLPASGELRDSAVPVFTEEVRFRGTESLVVLPLLSADEAIGTFTLASRRRHRFPKDVREMLGVIAIQVAISLQNALMYRKMETMATTDGLTGLTNHRSFQERFAQLLERADRHGHRAAVLLCDVDHFKQVNDTHGHPVGDEVLRRVARVLQAAVRRIDITARYGGEEFAVVLEATDLEGAVNLAERIRHDVGRLEIDSEKGRFRVTMSIGVATYPDDARGQEALIERADHALYHAKESGRNRVVTFRQFAEARKARTRAVG